MLPRRGGMQSAVRVRRPDIKAVGSRFPDPSRTTQGTSSEPMIAPAANTPQELFGAIQHLAQGLGELRRLVAQVVLARRAPRLQLEIFVGDVERGQHRDAD